MIEKISFSAVLFIVLLLVVNVVFLDLIVVTNAKKEPTSVVVSSSTNQPQPSVDQCLDSCKATIVSEIEKRLAVTTPAPIGVVQNVNTKASVKEYYVPLGSGVTKSADWEDLPGAEVYINTGNYPSIKSTLFEVYLHIPTANGRVYAKLYNVTDKHDVWFSEVFAEGNTVSRKEALVTLDPGNKLYRVMAKSTLQYDAYVDPARIKITTY